MGIKVITAPTLTSVLSLAELRLHLKVDNTDDDGQILLALAAAHRHAQHYTQCSIGQQLLELALDEFPCEGPIQLPQGPVASISSVTYVDPAGATQTVPSSDYALDDFQTPAWLVPAVNTTWPSTLAAVNAVRVQYVAGSNTPDDAVKYAMLLTVGHLYANREAVGPSNLAELPLGVQALLDTVRVWSM
jgi:uncharacterized phiE125 gp8 family phage protein